MDFSHAIQFGGELTNGVGSIAMRAGFVAETIESRLFDPHQLTIDLSDGGKS